MAPFSRGLVLVLTFWVVAWPAASIRTRSPDSGWWGTQEAFTLLQATRAPTPTGDFAESARIHPERAQERAANQDRIANHTIPTHNPSWIAEHFKAAGLNLALALHGGTSRTTEPGSAQAVERLKMRLAKMEAQAGLGSWRIKVENFLGNASLIHFHHRLRNFEILLSFGLGERELRQARTTDVDNIGGRLHTMRFGQVPEPKASGPAGLLSERHSLQVIAGALLPESLSPPPPLNGFLAAGDSTCSFAEGGCKSERPEGGRHAQ
jgi:hypothetical protein